MKSRSISLLALALLSVSLVGLTQNSASAAAPFGARATTSTPLVGEYLRIYGAVPPAKRPVRLLALRGGHWITAAVSKTHARGGYAFNVRATRSTVAYRVFAPKKKHKKARYSNILGVRGTSPTLALGAAVVENGSTVMGTAATMYPARPNTYVTLYRRLSNGKFAYSQRVKQNSAGVARFSVSPGSAGAPVTFKAVATPGRGAPATSSNWSVSQFVGTNFYDTFTDATASAQKWATRVQPPGGRRQCAQTDDALKSFDTAHGVAVLSAVKQSTNPKGTSACPYGFWHNGMIGTGAAATPYAPTYGVFAARMKFQSSHGAHGSFWLQGTGGSGAEIDTAEYFGDGRSDGGLANFVHADATGSTATSSGGVVRSSKAILGRGRTPSNGYHVYAVQWTPTGYVFRIDGVPSFATSKPRVSSAPSELVLSLLTSDYELRYMGRTTSISETVDWVRGWQ